MPSKYRKPKYRRRFKRRYGRRRRTNPVASRGIIPNSQIVKLRYVDTVTIDPATGLAGSHVFRANSIFDPDQTGVGHQPMGHDELANLYERYVVVGSKISVRFTSSGSLPGQSSANVGIILKDASTPETLPKTWMEKNKSVFTSMTTADGSRGTATLNKFFSAKKFFSIKNIVDNDRYGADFGSNPADSTYYHCIVAPADSSLDLQPFYLTVVIDYLVRVNKPKTLLAS